LPPNGIAFSQAMLKIAQTYGKGKYRGSAVSIFMRHEDGSVPSSDEMKKAYQNNKHHCSCLPME